MSDLIDREEALTALRDTLKSGGKSKGLRPVTFEMIWAIKSLPSAEPKTAVWVGEGDGYFDGEIVLDTWYCSKCNYLYDYDEKPDWNYCPNCGAKMEEAE